VSALRAWLRENAVSLVITAVGIALVVLYLDPIDTLKVVFGLGFIIFIHELGHFLAAKWCDVHVKTFSIGFGPAVPFCSYKWGETTYMVGIIPLGGYVSMVGEGDAAGEEDAEEDPRSFKRKPVWQRMVIISAGVVMNIALGMACFVAAYLHGVQEKPATVGWVESGGAAWRAGLRTDDDLLRIDSRERPFFNDIRPIVMSTRKGETVELQVRHAGQGEERTLRVEPLRDEGARFPQLGIAPPDRLTLPVVRKGDFRPVAPGSPAAKATDPGFEPGDRIVGMTDPDPAKGVTPLRPDPRDPSAGADIGDYYDRLAKLAKEPITFRVVRKDAPADATVDVVVQRAYRADLGVRMRMGQVVALRAGGPAEKAGVVAYTEAPAAPGDEIKTVKLPEAGGKQLWLTTGPLPGEDPKAAPPPAGVEVRKLDPVLLPLELKKWADRNPADRAVRLEVLRRVGPEERKPVELTLTYDPAYRHDREVLTLPNSPLALGGLGLAYLVEGVVDAVAPGGPADGKLQPNDVVTGVRFRAPEAGEDQSSWLGRAWRGALTWVGLRKEGGSGPPWKELKPHQWASAEGAIQQRPPGAVDLKVKRGGEEVEVTLEARKDEAWPAEERGLILQQDFRTQKAADVGDALKLGYRRTVRFVKEVYMNLYAMAFGRVSATTMSGPLTIANVSYRFAGEDFWQFLLFLGMISVNLAVVNFLPIPVLDGGHMVFLLLEWVLGRPVPERVFAIAMYTGLFLILSLMVFVLYLDVSRLFFG
jgi:regulator of sigma E protease